MDSNQNLVKDPKALLDARLKRAASSMENRCAELRKLTAASPEEQLALLSPKHHISSVGGLFSQFKLINNVRK